ncbi:MAG: hypothetical protein OEM01_15185 [Desulfobulbaceae bacterium]|nr:hypothetical protein [Desulfobulbaceae bacterium]
MTELQIDQVLTDVAAESNGLEISPHELEAVKRTLLSFLALFKSYNLYPAAHSICQNNLEKFLEELDSFLGNYEKLHLETRKNNFYYHGERIFTGYAEEINPAYLLTRDGLEYIEFIQGITSDEIARFINLLIQHRNPFEETEGDIVTALWQNNFTHILHQEADIFTLESFEFDLSSFKVTPDKAIVPNGTPEGSVNTLPREKSASRMEKGILDAATIEKNAQQEKGGSTGPAKHEPISRMEQNRFLSDQGKNLLELTTEEKKILAESVQEVETKNFTSDIIDVLIIILVTQHDRNNFTYVLEFIEFEFFETMDKGEFHLAFKLLNNLQVIRSQRIKSRPWIVPLIETFIAAISEIKKFKQISWIENDDSSWHKSPYLAQLWQVLQMLDPRIIFTLGPMLDRIPADSFQIRNEIRKIIENMAKQDPEKLGILLSESVQELNLLLAPVLLDLPQKDAANIYLQMTHHSSAEVRKIGLNGFMMSESNPDFDRLFHLLGDKNTQVRNRIITYLRNAGENIAATQLIRFLSQTTSSDPVDQKIIFLNYKALASCKSVGCIRFLERNLMESKLSGMFGTNTIHKKGAAFALKMIGTGEAIAILEKGAKSLRPDIRFASRKALEN